MGKRLARTTVDFLALVALAMIYYGLSLISAVAFWLGGGLLLLVVAVLLALWAGRQG
ncbi:MAG: hypothetical protein ACYC6L_02605 [Anaerolineae bacterium]